MRMILAFVFSFSAVAFAQDGGVITFVDKDAQLTHAGKTAPIQKGDKIAWGDTVALGFGAKAQITVGQQKISLLGKAKIILKQSMVPDVAVVELFEGQVRMKTPRMPPTFTGEPMPVVQTPTAVAGVRGTEFWISYALTGESEIIGIEKNVDFMTPDNKSRVIVKPGEWGGVGGKYGKYVKAPVKASVDTFKKVKTDLEFR